MTESTGRKEWRMTRDEPYSDPTCAGHDKLSAREGHYVIADTEDEAQEIMLERYPGETFTCEMWKQWEGWHNVRTKRFNR